MTFNMNRILVLLSLFLFLGCQQNLASQATNADQVTLDKNDIKPVVEKPTKETHMSYKGTIKYFNMEGGFYGIITEKGEKLLPSNLDKKFQQDGAIIEFSGNFKKDTITFQQWGKPFSISKVKLIKSGKKTLNPTH